MVFLTAVSNLDWFAVRDNCIEDKLCVLLSI